MSDLKLERAYVIALMETGAARSKYGSGFCG